MLSKYYFEQQKKKYYDLLNEAFKKQCKEITKERNDRSEINSQMRESMPNNTPASQVPSYTKPTPGVAANKHKAPTKNDGYLEPQPINNAKPNVPPQQSAYLEPVHGNTPSVTQSGYLDPVSKSKSPMSDTYTGGSHILQNASLEKDTYVNSGDSDYLNADEQNDTVDTGYVNDDIVNELDSHKYDAKSSDNYFKRVGSNASTSTANSTASSTAPLLKYAPKFTKIKTNPNINADNFKNFTQEKTAGDENSVGSIPRFTYTPPKPVYLNKLTQFKPNTTNETDV